ncbi:MAG TPA: FMN-binding protein [Firmicutes bacterium]|nr:FMN-binding protein [Bacillota bacterium]
MHESAKMVLVLLIIGAVCGGLLSMVNGVTQPVIEARAMAEFQEAMGTFFPDVVRADEEAVDGEEYYLCYDAADTFIGVVGKVKAAGYGGDIFYDLAVDAAGDIIGIRISEHAETAGIGDVITRPDFQDRIIGLNFADPIAPGVDVDTITGATVSTNGMINSIRRVMNVIGENFLGMEVEKAEADLSSVADGTYTGTATGFQPDLTVEVTVSGGAITAIEVVSHGETAGISDKAIAEMPGRIIDAQDLDVDTISGATMTSQGIINAVADALK